MQALQLGAPLGSPTPPVACVTGHDGSQPSPSGAVPKFSATGPSQSEGGAGTHCGSPSPSPSPESPSPSPSPASASPSPSIVDPASVESPALPAVLPWMGSLKHPATSIRVIGQQKSRTVRMYTHAT